MGIEVSQRQTKSGLRRCILELRRSLTAAERAAKSRQIWARCLALPALRREALLSCYLGFGEEVETADQVRSLFAAGRQIALPVCARGKPLPSFSLLQRWEDLEPNRFGILEPAPGQSPVVALSEISLFIVPGVGFDRTGNRLGFGLGFYDRALAGARGDALFVGLAFDCQIVDDIPRSAHDVPVHFIVTESRTIEASLSSGAAEGGVPDA